MTEGFLSVWTVSVEVGPLSQIHWAESGLWVGKWGTHCYETREKAEAAAVVAAASSPEYLGRIRVVERKVPHYNYPFAVRRKKRVGET